MTPKIIAGACILVCIAGMATIAHDVKEWWWGNGFADHWARLFGLALVAKLLEIYVRAEDGKRP